MSHGKAFHWSTTGSPSMSVGNDYAFPRFVVLEKDFECKKLKKCDEHHVCVQKISTRMRIPRARTTRHKLNLTLIRLQLKHRSKTQTSDGRNKSCTFDLPTFNGRRLSRCFQSARDSLSLVIHLLFVRSPARASEYGVLLNPVTAHRGFMSKNCPACSGVNAECDGPRRWVSTVMLDRLQFSTLNPSHCPNQDSKVVVHRSLHAGILQPPLMLRNSTPLCIHQVLTTHLLPATPCSFLRSVMAALTTALQEHLPTVFSRFSEFPETCTFLSFLYLSLGFHLFSDSGPKMTPQQQSREEGKRRAKVGICKIIWSAASATW